MTKTGPGRDPHNPFLAGAVSTGKPTAFDMRMQMALRQTGFDARPRETGSQPFVEPPAALAPSPPSHAGAATALSRREWLLSVMERQRALSTVAGGVSRIRDVSREAFLHAFYAPGRPVIIDGAIADWPALSLWTPDYLVEKVGSAPIEYQGKRTDQTDFELMKDRHKAMLPFDRFIRDHCAQAGNDAYITAYNSATNLSAFAVLHPDMRYIDAYLTPAHGMLWIGPTGTFTPLHFDLTNNLLVQIVGRKKVTLVPPSETRLLAHDRHVFSDVHDIEDAACLARHPQAQHARRFEIELAPGDMLYIPIGWWHQVRSVDFSVMMTATNFLWPNDGHAEFPG